ncbi:MAG: sulfur carrier protein ThiS [Deltaproteobacteria bacterium]|nr:sulfur carrier protein ThiS [Deltaproteobacteria bacterium]
MGLRIWVNGQMKEVPQGTTAKGLLAMLGLENALVAVERNEKVLPRSLHAETMLEEGDRIEIVHFVGGG